jgi:hypothetical protein
MAYLKDAWWNDLKELRSRTDKVYDKAGKDIWKTTAEKIVALRGWKISPETLVPILRELGVYYVPKTLIPGPMIVFPEIDASGEVTRAQTKPLHDLFGEGKYHTLGCKKEAFLGPVWLGNSDSTIERIIQTRTLTLVEGPFDLLAARAVTDNPVMSSLTKSIGEKHEIWLKLMKVNELNLLFDNEESEAGEKSAFWLARNLSIQVQCLRCPQGDPSDCLKSTVLRKRLERVLNDVE